MIVNEVAIAHAWDPMILYYLIWWQLARKPPSTDIYSCMAATLCSCMHVSMPVNVYMHAPLNNQTKIPLAKL
jgi:hypothetical protein